MRPVLFCLPGPGLSELPGRKKRMLMPKLLGLTSPFLMSSCYRYFVVAAVWEGDLFGNSFANLRKKVGLDPPEHLSVVYPLITLNSASERSPQQVLDALRPLPLMMK